MGLAVVAGMLLMVGGAQPQENVLRWIGCDICKAGFMELEAAEFEKKTGIKITLEEAGDSKGLEALAAHDGRYHMGGACRHTLNTPTEIGIKQVPVAWDALAIVVHPTNPLESITLEQVREIFTGKITNWKQLGGKDLPIVPIERKGRTSGVGLMARELIFRDQNLDYVSTTSLFDSTKPVEQACAKEPACVAISGISSARLQEGLKVLAVDGKAPTRENLVSGSYVLYRPLYLTFPSANPDPRVGRFVKFILSPEGQSLMQKSGTVSLSEGKDLWEKYRASIQSPGKP
ncbi:MAG: substrate-binding domain-containing protein [Deltaproteobacteria bacterium]|nr:substrate-binding domain-containing protein [Deltaproteobacteria bacterium]